jgi:hypothetical protein
VRGLCLITARDDLVQALRVLGAHRRNRGNRVAVCLSFDGSARVLTIGEDRGSVSATMPALGGWPPSGATVGLVMLRRAASHAPTQVELCATEDSVIVLTNRGYARLNLLQFGPDTRREQPQLDIHSDLPLFRQGFRPCSALELMRRVAFWMEQQDRA